MHNIGIYLHRGGIFVRQGVRVLSIIWAVSPGDEVCLEGKVNVDNQQGAQALIRSV